MASDVAPASFESLPAPLALRIFALLPADARARCAAVRRAWHTQLADPAAWARLDLSHSGGVTCGASAEDVLRCAAAKARGALQALDVSGLDTLRVDTLLQVLAANAGALTELRTATLVAHEQGTYTDGVGFLTPEDAAALLAAAPKLRTLDASVNSSPADAPPLLRQQGAFAPLRVTRLALTDNIVSHGMSAVAAFDVGFEGVAAGQRAFLLPVDACIAPLASALRDSRSLTALHCDALATGDFPEALAMILDALSGHPTLRELQIQMPHGAALPALAALLEADAAALTAVRVTPLDKLRNAELAPLLGALAHNTHLRTLDLGDDCSIGEAAAAAQLLPAVQACASLRTLVLGDAVAAPPSLRDAQALLAARAA